MADATWQDVLGAELSEENAGRLADVALAALDREMSSLLADGDLRELARVSALANLRLVADIAAGTVALNDAEPPPQAIAFARELARRNVPMSELARMYRVVQHTMWRVGVAEVRRRMAAGTTAAAVEDLTDATFATGEVLMSAALDQYAAERDRWVRSADALRRETVQAILDGEPLDVDTASARLRYELRGTHVGFVAATPPPDEFDGLVLPLGPELTAGWAHVLGELPTPCAVSTPGEGIEGFRVAHREALAAWRVVQMAGLGGVTRYEDVALVALLTTDLAAARAFAARELGELADERVADTVLELLLAQGSPRRAAAVLGVHENTVAKRVKAAEALLGRPVDERPAELLAALLIARETR